MKYNDLVAHLGGKDHKLIKRTRSQTEAIRMDDNVIGIRHHDTMIMKYHPNGDIVLDCDGWRTATTKQRLNDYLPRPWTVYQEKHVWYLSRFDNWDKVWTFTDGMVICANGDVTGDLDNAKQIAERVEAVRKYSKAFVKALMAGKVNKPGAGDCLYCLWRTEDRATFGESKGDKDHLESHVELRYFVPSLLQRAIEVFPISPLAGTVLASKWELYEAQIDDLHQSWLDLASDQMYKSLFRYIKRQLGLA